MPVWTMDMYQTLAFAVIALLIGYFLRRKISFLERFCIPPPVIGGLLREWFEQGRPFDNAAQAFFTEEYRDYLFRIGE